MSYPSGLRTHDPPGSVQAGIDAQFMFALVPHSARILRIPRGNRAQQTDDRIGVTMSIDIKKDYNHNENVRRLLNTREAHRIRFLKTEMLSDDEIFASKWEIKVRSGRDD